MQSVKKIIQERSFRQSEFNQNFQTMSNFFKALNEMEIDSNTFKIMRILIKFFWFPVLLLFKPIYRRIDRHQETYLEEYRPDLLKTAAFARAIIKQRSLPSLDFYFKAGCDSQMPPQLLGDEPDPKFISLFEKIDQKLATIVPTSKEEPTLLSQLQAKIEKQINKTTLVIQKLCLLELVSTIKTRLAQINKQRSLQLMPLNKVSGKSGTIRIQANKNSEQIIKDPQAGVDLCCRSYFYMNEIIEEPQTLVQQYKNYSYPYDSHCGDILTKTICGFLNARGGIIYIGIKEDVATKKRTVFGEKYSESIKEKLLTYFRIRCQKISPEIVNQQFYKIEYVPIKDPSRNNVWLPGMFLLRIKVQKGNKNDLYSFKKDDNTELFAFRTQNEVLSYPICQHILQVYRKRLESEDTQDQNYINHPGPCRPVELGRQVFEQDSTVITHYDKKQNYKSGYPQNYKPFYQQKPVYQQKTVYHQKFQGKYDFKMS